jgi:hypothetical protein
LPKTILAPRLAKVSSSTAEYGLVTHDHCPI